MPHQVNPKSPLAIMHKAQSVKDSALAAYYTESRFHAANLREEAESLRDALNAFLAEDDTQEAESE